MKTFKEECEEWLKPFGYTVHAHNPTNTSIGFLNPELDYSPYIDCFINEVGEKVCKLSGGGVKMFCSIKSGNLIFKHPDIKKYIDALCHYSKLCYENPPF